MLREYAEKGKIHNLVASPNHKNICLAYNEGFKYVKSEYFIMMQDDITIAKLEPKDIIEQLIDLMDKYPVHGSIGTRIQRIPNLKTNEGNDDLIPARKALSAYFRIQRRDDYIKMGLLPSKDWDDRAFLSRIRNIGKEGSWARNLYSDHSRGYCPERGYFVKPRKWGIGIHHRIAQEIERKPYPKIDNYTCVPLPNQKIYR
jgi:glycosyltransferase involved in cell wall biosynthesis